MLPTPLISSDYDVFINTDEIDRFIEKFLLLCVCLCVLTQACISGELMPASAVPCFFLIFLTSRGCLNYTHVTWQSRGKDVTFWSWRVSVCMCMNMVCMCMCVKFTRAAFGLARALPRCQAPCSGLEGCSRGPAQRQSLLHSRWCFTLFRPSRLLR